MSAFVPGGVICPIATPLDGSGEPSLDILADHVRWLAPKVDGLVVLGSSGELATLPEDSIRKILDTAVAAVGDDLALYVGIGDASLARVLARVRELPSRADFVLVCGPYYFQATSQRALVEHFTAVADASPRPVVLYNLPQNVGVAITLATVTELAQHPNIIGIKDSSGDMLTFMAMLQTAPERFRIMQGREQLAAISRWAGSHGVVSSLSNFAPERLRGLLQAVDAGDRVLARKLQAELSDLARVFDQGHWVAALKAVLQELGLAVGAPVPPLPPCSPEERAEIRRILAVHGIAPINPPVA